jgi:hypothetical protein
LIDPLTVKMKEALRWSDEQATFQKEEMGRLIVEASVF